MTGCAFERPGLFPRHLSAREQVRPTGYLGVATSNWSDEDWWYGDDSAPWPGRHIFGWVKLRLVEELGEYHLEQLESAVAFNCGGIIIGTLIAVPEPSTLLLCIIALGVVGGWRKWSE